MAKTIQIKKWSSQFGKTYTDRCKASLEELEQLSRRLFGVTRTEMNKDFLGDLNRSISVLEVGTNIGNQLGLLQKIGFNNLDGIDPQGYALEIAKQKFPDINFVQASAFDIPFSDNSFDLIFTSNVLIHIAPKDLSMAMKEIYRCSKKYIWGFEYYAEAMTMIPYRGNNQLLWKGDHVAEYLKLFSDLKILKQKVYKYTDSDNQDKMFLLAKK